jgi:hypothetical protein
MASGRRDESFEIFFTYPIDRLKGEQEPSLSRSALPADAGDVEPAAPEEDGACPELGSRKR